MKKLLLFLVFYMMSNAICSSQANALKEEVNSYYVSTEGDDDNVGSIDSPWKSIEKVNKALANDANNGFLLPGDKILF